MNIYTLGTYWIPNCTSASERSSRKKQSNWITMKAFFSVFPAFCLFSITGHSLPSQLHPWITAYQLGFSPLVFPPSNLPTLQPETYIIWGQKCYGDNSQLRTKILEIPLLSLMRRAVHQNLLGNPQSPDSCEENGRRRRRVSFRESSVILGA